MAMFFGCTDPTKMHHNRGLKLPPEPLTDEEVNRIYEFLDKSWASYAYRGMAYVTLCLRGLLRSSEAISLYPKDVDLESGLVRVLWGKGKKCRVIGIDRKSCQIIKEWLDYRVVLGIGLDCPIICTIKAPRRGLSVVSSWTRTFMDNIGKKCGIMKRVHPHGLRHTGAFQMLNEGAPLQIIQKQLGHSNIATTHQYVNHINPTAVINYMASRKW